MSMLAVAQDNLFPTRTLAVPAYLPEELRERLAGKRLRVTVPLGARRRVRTAEKLAPSVWNERHRRVPVGEASPGPWRREYAPHLPAILDLVWQPHVREFWYCGPERDAKTNFLLGYAGWSIDSKPGNIYYLMPSEEKAKQIVSEKIRPMLEESPRLARFLGENRRLDITQSLIRLTNGVRIFPAHARSATSLASFSALIGLGDEVDKYEETVGKETDAITLLRKRLREHRNRSKLVLASTPAGRFIHAGATACQMVLVTEIKCPACGEFHRAGEEGLVIPEGATVEGVKALEVEVFQACTSCGHLMDDADLDHARRSFRLTAVKGGEVSRPATIGLLRTAWDCIHVPLAEIAVAKLKADTGSLAERRDYAHGYKCVDHQEEFAERKEDGILRLRDDRPLGIVPTWADALEASVDTQGNGFWYRIRAWKFGMELESALVKCGFVPTLNALEAVTIGSEYLDAAGGKYRLQAGIIDSAGHRTAEIYEWCRRTGFLPAKGASSRKNQPMTVGKIDHYPGTNKAIPGGLRLYHIDTHYHKDALAAKLMIEPGDQGCFWLHSGFSDTQLAELARTPGLKLPNALEQYARQMCAEGRDERGLWICAHGKANHLWDCESNGLALVMYLGWQNKVSEGSSLPAPERTRRVYSKGVRRD